MAELAHSVQREQLARGGSGGRVAVLFECVVSVARDGGAKPCDEQVAAAAAHAHMDDHHGGDGVRRAHADVQDPGLRAAGGSQHDHGGV